MKYTSSILLSALSFLPSNNAADVLLHLNGEDLEGHRHLRGREKGEGKDNSQKVEFMSTIRKAAASTGGIGYKGKRRRLEKKPRLVGGKTVRDDRYSFYVELDLGCGGTLIAEDIVLTAAHCLQQGSWTPDASIGSNFTTYRRLNGVSINPGFSNLDGSNNFALLTLNEPVPDSGVDGIAPVPLNGESNNPSEGDILTTMGLGLNGSTLEEVNVPYFPFDQCENIYRLADLMFTNETMFCAGGESGEDSCDGDSGGPILDSNGAQVGIVAFGLECGMEGVPAVYSRVSSAIDWIDDFKCQNALSMDKMPSNCGYRCPVKIEIDEWNDEEIHWNLGSIDEVRNLLFVPPDYYPSSGSYNRTVNLAPGNYRFQINSFRENGVQGGNYSISMVCEGTVIERSGAFGAMDIVDFVVTETNSSASSPATAATLPTNSSTSSTTTESSPATLPTNSSTSSATLESGPSKLPTNSSTSPATEESSPAALPTNSSTSSSTANSSSATLPTNSSTSSATADSSPATLPTNSSTSSSTARNSPAP